jgi:hypothetical protein
LFLLLVRTVGSGHQVLRLSGAPGFDVVNQLVGEELHRTV